MLSNLLCNYHISLQFSYQFAILTFCCTVPMWKFAIFISDCNFHISLWFSCHDSSTYLLVPKTPVLNWVHCTELSRTCWAKKLRVAVMRWQLPAICSTFFFAPFSSIVFCWFVYWFFYVCWLPVRGILITKNTISQTTSGLANFNT
jgi:hypothetical protein